MKPILLDENPHEGEEQQAAMVRQAISYVRKFHAVVPCGAWTFTGRDGKEVDMWKNPLIKNWTREPLKTETQVRRFWMIQWERYRQTPGIGIATGQICGGYYVIDFDRHPERGIDGYDYMKQWERENGVKLPDTWQVITGSGGLHMWFKSNRAMRGYANTEIGVDLRADGNYIVVPPSLHKSGKSYEWEAGYSPKDVDCAEMDEVVMQFIRDCRPNGSEYRQSTRRGEGGERKMKLPEEIPDGGRHEALVSVIGTLNILGVSDEAIEALVRHENEEKCNPPLDEDELQKEIFPAIYRFEKGVAAEKWQEKEEYKKQQNILRERERRRQKCLQS